MKSILPGNTIGIIGGGQLGKMLAQAANTMGYRVIVLDPAPDAPAFSCAHESIVAAFDDPMGVEALVAKAQLVTYEFENINAPLVASLNARYHTIPQGAKPLLITQNRKHEKAALTEAGLTVAPYMVLDNIATEIHNAVEQLGYPFVVKTQEGGYDGKGQVVVRSHNDLAALESLSGIACVAEQFIPYERECSLIGTRSISGEFRAFPIAENVHRNNILFKTVAGSSKITPATETALTEMLQGFMLRHDIVGTLAMEAFLLQDKIYVNELAPRPHNSGHFTLEGCATSQFEQHIRALCGLPLGATTLHQPCVMYNLLGQDLKPLYDALPKLSPEAHLHLYGKSAAHPNRKMGHITFMDLAAAASFEQDIFTL